MVAHVTRVRPQRSRGPAAEDALGRRPPRARCRSAFEVYLEHYKGSFGDTLGVGAAGAARRRWSPPAWPARSPSARRKTALPAAAALYALNGIVGSVAARARRRSASPAASREPTYNLVMGPPLLAPGSLHTGRRARAAGRDHAPGALRRCRTTAAQDTFPTTGADELPADPDEPAAPAPRTTPQMHGRYPDYDVLEQAGHWDEVTRKVVLARVHDVPPIRFFDADEVADAAGVLRHGARPGRASRGSRCSRWSTPSCTPASSTATATPACPTTARPCGSSLRGLDEAAGAGAVRRAPRERAARRSLSAHVAGASSRAACGTSSTSQTAWKVCHADRCVGRSTRTRGRGTRSASAAPPTRAATRALGDRHERDLGGRAGARPRPGPDVARARRRP